MTPQNKNNALWEHFYKGAVFMSQKTYVCVVAKFDVNGNIHPVSITLEDGRSYPIHKIIDFRSRSSLKDGGEGLRYTCIISGKTSYLVYDNKRWYIDQNS